ncbi:MAG: hypothetical protein L3J39_08850 [Verrucomicrobiales bacterium]|nr:hypothetical protein [Verrucomicrobiales bacterium]
MAETCYDLNLKFNQSRFQAKYGSLPSFCDLPKSKPSYYSSWDSWNPKHATRLNLLLFPFGYPEEYIVPEDLAERLKEFVPAPKELTMATLSEPKQEDGLYLRLTEHEALSEVMALLRLCEQGNLRITAKTGMPTAAGRVKIIECLTGEDYFPTEVAYLLNKHSYQQEIGPIKPVAWSRLLKASRYVSPSSKLTSAGIKALSLPPHEVIKHLWGKWLTNSNYDEFNRVSIIKGQNSKKHMTSKPPRRNAIVAGLLDCPTNQWVELETFSNYMQAQGFEFDVSNNPGKLYLCEHRYGSFDYAGYGGWNILQLRYIFSFLFEYAAPLGLIDIAYVHPEDALGDYRDQWGGDDIEWLSRYDGLRAFRITKLGAYCLGMSDEFTPTQPVSSLKLEVSSDLNIHIISGELQVAQKFLLDTWANPTANNTWLLDPQRACQAVERGQNTADFAQFLNQHGDQLLPESVAAFLKRSETNGKALKHLSDAQIFECNHPSTADRIANLDALKKSCFRIGKTQLVVPAKRVAQFKKTVRSLGLGIV